MSNIGPCFSLFTPHFAGSGEERRGEGPDSARHCSGPSLPGKIEIIIEDFRPCSDTLISSNKYRSNSPERKARLVVLVLPLNYNKLLQMSLIVVLVGTTKMFVCFRKDFLMGDSIWWQVLLILIGDLLKKFILPNQIRS